MVGPIRSQFVLFGSSIVQLSFGFDGWGAALSHLYARKADVVLRGYSGWTSRDALKILDQVFPQNDRVQPSLAIVYFGGNDSMEPPTSDGPLVPLSEYKENMRRIALHLKSLSETIRIIFLSVPPINEEMIKEYFGGEMGRTNEGCRIYSEACLEVSKEMEITAIDLWTAIQQRENWLTTCFLDGIHLSGEGSKIVVKEILRVVRNADWKPSLYWQYMPSEFQGISAIDPENDENHKIHKILKSELEKNLI
ncbi:hypothetical protein JCGZ_25018 [Jatropha curcas]|uniref:SGNH hydrolase-type esterase domain-containing protein n=1 Tax=Jatropha curcas TaxID=180498 RepID=A0A067JY26_JATCU|nr:GDSL esterase/lipase CPRD49 [Jatropha curcas]KDP24454.1 hypothetical protein JCGZ_25018 [Jatropha curcas]